MNLANISQNQYEKLMALLGDEKQEMPSVNFIGNVSRSSFKHKGWILNSKTSGHVVSEGALLKSHTKSLSTIRVTMPNGERAVEDGIRTMEINRGHSIESCFVIF